MSPKPWLKIAIEENREPLLPIPGDRFALIDPHPYAALGADYAERSPFWLRASVLGRLLRAQAQLSLLRPGYQLQIFDAYRPLTVQQFMVDYTRQQLLADQGLTAETADPATLAVVNDQVFTFWAAPNEDPKQPPPHSTGAAVDLTILAADGQALDMGSPIDEPSDRSYPDYFLGRSPVAHQNRELLNQVMTAAGFVRHPNEWWHFSFGDQLWAWRVQVPAAMFGRYALLETD